MLLLNKLMSTIAILLSAAVIITTVPAGADAAAEQALNYQKPANAADETEIISEIKEKRESNVKHFLMRNGNYAAAVYPYDIHYENQNGELEEINNSLTAENDGNDDVFSNQSNIITAKFMKKSNASKLYTIKKGANQIKVSIEGASKVKSVTEEDSENKDNNDFSLKNICSKITYKNIFKTPILNMK